MRVSNILLLLLPLSSCNWATDKARRAAHKGGEIVAETGSEFTDGVSSGIDKIFKNKFVVDPTLQQKIEVGNISVSSTDSTTENMMTAYLIFHQDISQLITVRLLNAQGVEYGRTAALVYGKQGQGQNIDFIFDARTHIGVRGKMLFE